MNVGLLPALQPVAGLLHYKKMRGIYLFLLYILEATKAGIQFVDNLF